MITVRLSAQTNLPSVLACNEILTITGSPYIVDSTITIKPGCTLTVNPGVEIKMAENTHLIVQGKADFLGSASQPILIHAKDSIWGNILLDSTLLVKSTFKYVNIENTRQSVNPIDEEPGAINGFFSTLDVQNCYFADVRCGIIMYGCDNSIIKDNTFDSPNPNIGEKIHGMYCNHVIVDNNIFNPTYGDCDVIDFDASNDIMISNNYFNSGGDDGIDLGQVDQVGCDSITIQGNYFYNMMNKGISNGELVTNIFIHHNIIVGCQLGIGAKSGAQVISDHNTIYHCRMGVKSYHHLHQAWPPGNLTVTNSIIADCDTTFHVDSTAFLSISYSLADDTLMPGTGNIVGDPIFVSPQVSYWPDVSNSGNFHLLPNSQAINAGDPAFEFDPDGSRSDIGRFYLGQTLGITSHQNPKDVLIYPNPSNGIFILNLIPNYSINHLVILNSLGQVLYKKQFYGDITEYSVDLNSQSPGVYYMQLLSENNTSIKKIVIY